MVKKPAFDNNKVIEEKMIKKYKNSIIADNTAATISPTMYFCLPTLPLYENRLNDQEFFLTTISGSIIFF